MPLRTALIKRFSSGVEKTETRESAARRRLLKAAPLATPAVSDKRRKDNPLSLRMSGNHRPSSFFAS